jgi:hypothetical protein
MPIPIIASDMTITSTSIVSHVGMRFAGWVIACALRSHVMYRKSASGCERVHMFEQPRPASPPWHLPDILSLAGDVRLHPTRTLAIAGQRSVCEVRDHSSASSTRWRMSQWRARSAAYHQRSGALDPSFTISPATPDHTCTERQLQPTKVAASTPMRTVLIQFLS